MKTKKGGTGVIVLFGIFLFLTLMGGVYLFSQTATTEKTIKKKKVKQEARVDFVVAEKLADWGFASADNRKIDTILLHTSYNALGEDVYDVDKVLAEYKQYGVSPHYLIDRKGQIYKLVQEKDIAYHAGKGTMPDGRTGVNDFSIGIELLNTKTDVMTNDEYDALNWLIADIKTRHEITNILGHSDITPGRKSDPWKIEWAKVKK